MGTVGQLFSTKRTWGRCYEYGWLGEYDGPYLKGLYEYGSLGKYDETYSKELYEYVLSRKNNGTYSGWVL
ncbi:hypothetical protein F7D09_1280 [Bifidobacterium leontopitheci]|uniref:Uncharacterized protein n=1 Tax=Bifidobacterium leontopitheci TaxID=2650774 RepID=A0A6I1GQ35_9BIFI|nr:hypothetical protein F7D09_1280 [Bifidobacterium leontopitheci]